MAARIGRIQIGSLWRHVVFSSRVVAKDYLLLAMKRYKGHIANRIEKLRMLVGQNQKLIQELELILGDLK